MESGESRGPRQPKSAQGKSNRVSSGSGWASWPDATQNWEGHALAKVAARDGRLVKAP